MFKSIFLSLGNVMPDNITNEFLRKANYKSAIILNPQLNVVKEDTYFDYSYLSIGTTFVPRHVFFENDNSFLITEKDYEISEQIIRRYAELYQFSELKNIKKTVNTILNFCSSILIENNVDTAVFPMIPHQNIEYFFYLAAEYNGLNIIYDSWLPNIKNTPSLYFLSDEMNSFGSLFMENYKNNKISNVDDSNPLNLFYSAYTSSEKTNLQEFKTYSRSRVNIKNIKQNIFNAYKYLKYNNIAQTLKRVLSFIIARLIYLTKNAGEYYALTFVDRISKNEFDMGLNYIYFPLHFQPEATTIPAGELFYNQFKLIEKISELLPDDMIVLVKEHPTYWENPHSSLLNSRKISDYKSLKKLKNIILVDKSYSTYDLIKNSFCVMTITGTVAFEALAWGKYSINFGKSPYRDLINSININSLELLNDSLTFIGLNTFDGKKEFNRVICSLNDLVYWNEPENSSVLFEKKLTKIKNFMFVNL